MCLLWFTNKEFKVKIVLLPQSDTVNNVFVLSDFCVHYILYSIYFQLFVNSVIFPAVSCPDLLAMFSDPRHSTLSLFRWQDLVKNRALESSTFGYLI